MIRKLTIVFIAVMPFNKFRIFLYRIFLKYDISYQATIGILNYIDCKKCKIEKEAKIFYLNRIEINSLEMDEQSIIHSFNNIVSFNSMSIGLNSVIMKKNNFIGVKKGITPFKEKENLIIGINCGILYSNHIDISDEVILGNNVVFAGLGHQIWTHGFTLDRIKIQSPISIGDNVYFGSRCIVLPMVSICSNVEVGAGTTVSKAITESGFYISSSQGRKKDILTLKDNEIEYFNNSKFFRKRK